MNGKVILETSAEGYSTGQIRETMTVKELIEILSGFDDDAKVYFSNDNGYTYGGIHYDSISEE